MLILLPLLTAGIAPVHHDTNAALEQALVAQIRADVKAGWQVIDGRGWDAGVSVAKDGVVMRRSIVVEDDGEGGTITTTATPALDEPRTDDFITQSITRGGVSLETGCGDWYLSYYVIEDRARGAAAGKLVAEALRTADDVESASHDGGVVAFTLERDHEGLELLVELADDHTIDRATLKRVRYAIDEGTYQRRNRLRQSLRGKAVTAIDTASSEVVLVVGAKRFALDPDRDAFVAHPRDPEDTGCGC